MRTERLGLGELPIAEPADTSAAACIRHFELIPQRRSRQRHYSCDPTRHSTHQHTEPTTHGDPNTNAEIARLWRDQNADWDMSSACLGSSAWEAAHDLHHNPNH